MSIGSTDERRLQVKAYNYWSGLLNDAEIPNIVQLEPSEIEAFSSNSLLIDLTRGIEDPVISFVGSSLRDEAGIDAETRTLSKAPSFSVISRITEHYMQVVANRSPVGFEAEYTNLKNHDIQYRGIIMPFTSDGKTIDYIYGVINWKDLGETADSPHGPKVAVLPAGPVMHPQEAPAEDELLLSNDMAMQGEDAYHPEPVHEPELPPVSVDLDSQLADFLAAARESADITHNADGRSRAALYRTLALAYDFSIASQRVPDDYQDLLENAGIKESPRSPMTPVVKLVFGATYEKARLTEYAAALSYASRNSIDFGEFEAFVNAAQGGLKGIINAERLARRPNKKSHAELVEEGKERLRGRAPIDFAELPADEEFALMVMRREDDGGYVPVMAGNSRSLLEKLIIKA